MEYSVSEYSLTAAQKGWGSGWPNCGGITTFGRATVTADDSGTKISVNSRIARLVDMLLDWTETGGDYLLKPTSCGGYNCRAISGTNKPSNHSWGLAVDLNWNDNPYTTFSGRRTIPWDVCLKWERYGFAIGGRYGDWMHLEFMGSPRDADAMTALALRELTGQPEEDEDDMAGAFPIELPDSNTADKTAKYSKGHLEIIPVPPNNGQGAARDAAAVWLQLYAGWEPVKIYQLAARGKAGDNWVDLLPFVDPNKADAQPWILDWNGVKGPDGVERNSFRLPDRCIAVEFLYESPLAFSALVEWRKL